MLTLLSTIRTQPELTCTLLTNQPAPTTLYVTPASMLEIMKRSHEDDVSNNNRSSIRNNTAAPASKIPHKSSVCEVFLGGSCNPTTWRSDIAIPVLKQGGITYFNPQVSSWAPELMEAEHLAKSNAQILFFVIDNQTRAIAALVEVAYLVGLRKNVVLVMKGLGEVGTCVIMGEVVSRHEFQDLTRGQSVVKELVERHEVPVFNEVLPALQWASKVVDEVRGDKVPQNKCYWICTKLRKTFETLAGSEDRIRIEDVRQAFRTLMNCDLSKEDILPVRDIPTADSNLDTLNYDQFSSIMTQLVYKKQTRDAYSEGVMKKLLESVPLSPSPSSESSSADIYLGGCCSGESWREEVAIPYLTKHGLRSLNPEEDASTLSMENCRVLLFHISGGARGLDALALAAYYIGLKRRPVILSIENLKEDCGIGGETLSSLALKDYNRGRSYLSDIATRDGVPVFTDNLELALKAVVEKAGEVPS